MGNNATGGDISAGVVEV